MKTNPRKKRATQKFTDGFKQALKSAFVIYNTGMRKKVWDMRKWFGMFFMCSYNLELLHL